MEIYLFLILLGSCLILALRKRNSLYMLIPFITFIIYFLIQFPYLTVHFFKLFFNA